MRFKPSCDFPAGTPPHNLPDKKKWEIVDACEMLSDVRASNVAAVTATVRRRILPLVLDQRLRRRDVVGEECAR